MFQDGVEIYHPNGSRLLIRSVHLALNRSPPFRRLAAAPRPVPRRVASQGLSGIHLILYFAKRRNGCFFSFWHRSRTQGPGSPSPIAHCSHASLGGAMRLSDNGRAPTRPFYGIQPLGGTQACGTANGTQRRAVDPLPSRTIGGRRRDRRLVVATSATRPTDSQWHGNGQTATSHTGRRAVPHWTGRFPVDDLAHRSGL